MNIRQHLDHSFKLHKHSIGKPMLFQTMPLQFHIRFQPPTGLAASALAPFLGTGSIGANAPSTSALAEK